MDKLTSYLEAVERRAEQEYMRPDKWDRDAARFELVREDVPRLLRLLRAAMIVMGDGCVTRPSCKTEFRKAIEKELSRHDNESKNIP